MKTKIISLALSLIIVIVCALTLVGCNNLEPKGEFYTLQQAYDDGLITQEDLWSIAYYYCNGIDYSDFNGVDYSAITPIPKNPKILDEKTLAKITNDALIKLLAEKDKDGRQLHPKATAKDIRVGYYGTYNGMIAVVIEDSFTPYVDVELQDTIGGVIFTYGNRAFPILWKENIATD